MRFCLLLWFLAAMPAQAQLRFERVSNELTAEKMGAVGSAWIDIDRDGRVDVAIAARDSHPSRAYRNLGGGRFQRIPLDINLRHNVNGVVWTDVDRDGDSDLMLAQDAPVLYLNSSANGNIKLERSTDAGVLTGERRPVGGYEAIAAGDLDKDGDLDLIGGTWGPFGVIALVNDGAGRFSVHPRDDFPFRSSTGGAHLVDFDGDDRPDVLFTGTQTADFRIGTFVYWNTPNGWVADRDQPFSRHHRALGSSAADVDSDGDLDLFVAGWSTEAPSQLYRNEGGRRFTPTGLEFPSRVVGSAFGDIDSDGDLDLVTAAGYTDQGTIEVFLGDGTGRFERSTIEGLSGTTGIHSGLALVDYDADGRLDLYVSSLEEPSRLFRNVGQAGNQWLQVELRESAGKAPIWGAMVMAEIETPQGLSVRRVSIHQQTGYAGHTEPVAHFGLAPGSRIRSVRVVWPTGAVSAVRGEGTNRRVVVSPP